ncbi:hypothetical protein ACLKA7_006318 [Drosophila subpalustris]
MKLVLCSSSEAAWELFDNSSDMSMELQKGAADSTNVAASKSGNICVETLLSSVSRAASMSAEDHVKGNPQERAMYNWLAAWRALNDEVLRLQTKAMRFQELIGLAANQIECYENILKERQFLNDKFFKCIANAGKKNFLVHKEYTEKVDQIIMLKDQLCLAKNTLKNHKLQLECAKEKLLNKAANFEHARKSLEESKAINKNLREYNLTLNALKRETMELYKSRDLMSVYQRIEKAQELINAQDKIKAVASASTYLQT